MALKTDYVNEQLPEGLTRRVYNIVDQSGNIVIPNVSLEKAYVPAVEGDEFGADDVNATNEDVNDSYKPFTEAIFTLPEEYENIASEENIPTILGKLQKWIGYLGDADSLYIDTNLTSATNRSLKYYTSQEVVNANDLLVTGVYSYNGATNAPAIGWVNYIVLRINNNPSVCQQIALLGSGAMYTRATGSGASGWTAWRSPTPRASALSGTLNRIGNLVTWSPNTIRNLTAGTNTDLGNLIPTGYRPTLSVYVSVVPVAGNIVGGSARFAVTSSGQVYAKTSASGNYEYGFCTSWYTDDAFPK